jgi:hypothetical protein
MDAMINWGLSPPLHLVHRIDVFRCFLDDADLADELNRMDSYQSGPLFLLRADETEWLWQKNSELVAGDDIRSNQRIMIRRFWGSVSTVYFDHTDEIQFPLVSMGRDILNDIQYGRCQIFRDMFRTCESLMDGYILGAWFLDWLISLDLDPETCVANEPAELEYLEYPRYSRKRIVFERNWEQKWILGFEWGFDHKAPGYSLVSQYTNLVVEYYWRTTWPFHEREHLCNRNWDDRNTLFNRRMDAKERKERARLGQKQPQSRMPGAWKW